MFRAQSQASWATMGAGGDFDLASAGLGICGLGGRRRWSGRACVGGDFARIRAEGLGVSEINSATAWWQSLWVGATAELSLARHLALTLGAEAAAGLYRPRFVINNAPSAFSPKPIGATVALGLEVPF